MAMAMFLVCLWHFVAARRVVSAL